MKKFISYFAVVLCFVVSFSSCNTEDSNGKEGLNDFDVNEGYIEVTIDGKTYKETVYDLSFLPYFPIEEWGKESLSGYYGDFDREHGFELTWSFICYKDARKLLDCSIGEYPYECANEYSNSYGEDGNDENFPKNLSFHICEYEDPNRDFSCELHDRNNGSHQVTSIKKKGENIIVEGTFDATLGDNELNIKGKYLFITSCE